MNNRNNREVFTIDYVQLCKEVDELSVKNPQRTYGNLDILRENISNNLSMLEGEKGIFEIDHINRSVTKLGQKLRGKYKTIPVHGLSETFDELFYRQVISAISYAEDLGIRDQIFDVIRK